MRTKLTFSILFWIYGSRADRNNSSNIYARITLNGEKLNFSVKRKINVDSWDSKRQRARGSSEQSRSINYYLDEVKSELISSYRDLKSESKVITPQLIKARFLGEDKKEHSLKNIFKYHNEKLGIKLAKKTLCDHKTSQKYILSYPKQITH